MKIKPSLKIYFIAAMFLLGSAMTLSFSALMLNYFSQGLDRGVMHAMEVAADVEGVEQGKTVNVLGYQVSSSWEELPEQIKSVFDNTPPAEVHKLEKKALGESLISPPDKVFLLLKTFSKSGQLRYISRTINKNTMRIAKRHGLPHFVWIGIIALISIGFFLGVILFVLRRVTKPVESLKNWAKSLDEDKLHQPIPDFQYNELNALAEIINSSLNTVQSSLARELQFLSYASHELRTPISVVRANTELLLKLHEKEGGSDKQYAVLQRVDRAGKTMTNLTDTLLWLSRDDANLPDSEKVDIAQLIEQLVVELNYLINAKPVTLELTTQPYILHAAAIPCRIVLANLIRNAFQHTIEGKVSIIQCGTKVTIINTSESKEIDTADLGFGLGLQLTKKLAGRYGWIYSENIETKRYQVIIQF